MQTIAQLLQARAADSSGRVFCRFEDRQTTFGQLLRGVQEMAGVLAGAGAGPGLRIGYLMPSSVEHIQLYLAASWLGACAVPFSIHMKSAGLELQLRSSRPRLMVASRTHAESLREAIATLDSPPHILWLEDGAGTETETCVGAQLQATRSLAAPAARGLDDPVAISYTSGTTGAPKGVVMSERYYWIGAKNAGILSAARRDDVFFMWEPFYHLAAWMTVLMALQHGLRIHMVERFSASRLWEQIGEARATKFHYLGGLVNIILSQPPMAAERNSSLAIAWGAACPADSWRSFEDRFGVAVREGYGISEVQNFTHLNLDGVIGSIGKPVEEFDAWAVRENGERCAPGELGELVLKPHRPGVTMSGYFGEPEKTWEVLRGDGTAHTGDLAVQDADGNFYFKGRRKDALRRRGENVSAWEVERVLNQAPGVEESAVVGVDASVGEQDILAVLKLRAGARIDPLDILRFCSDRLAYYQVPRYVQFVEEFPRGPTQRIRKNELKIEPHLAWDSEKAGFKPARTA